MNKLLVHLGLLLTCIILLSGCTSGGSLPKEEKLDEPEAPTPDGLPVYAEIVEPYLNTSVEEVNGKDVVLLGLYSYKSQASVDAEPSETEIFSSPSDIIVTLNTQADTMGRSEYTLLVKNDNVYLVNHSNNQLRLLSHFINQVCEILPTERVDETLDPDTGERVLTVLHDELVYVMTAEQKLGSTGDDCHSDTKKRYYELPLDHQLDPSLDETDGELDSLGLVKESVARSKLIFGWVPDPDNVGQDRIEYAYLGFDSENQELSLFDEDKQIVWSQPRELEAFDVIELAPNRYSSKYLFHVRALSNYQYLIQLGLDVFVVDAGLDLMAKAFNETDTILTDKVLTITPGYALENKLPVSYARTVYATSDADDLILFDYSKMFHLSYQDNVPARNPSKAARIVYQNPMMIDNDYHLYQNMFSQFDLQACESSDADCLAAHDVEAQTWQFFTPCEEQYGCEVLPNTADNCETAAEKLQTQSNAPLCTASDYRHIAELNDLENDAELNAFMQYANQNFVRNLQAILSDNQLFFTVNMNQKDLFLSYDFNAGFDVPKSVREHVYFGKRASLTGMDAYLDAGNLFLTALQKGALRSNECYKNQQKVLCDLSEIQEEGNSNVCTGKDLSLGACVNSFSEYESKALFCSAAQINDLSCSDANLTQLDSLAVESAEEDAKWLSLVDYPNARYSMYLLAGNHTLALETQNLDEGKLYMPSLYSVDQTTGQKESFIASLEGGVEKVVGGWFSKTATLGESEVFGQLYLIADEVVQHGGINNQRDGRLATYLLEQTYGDLSVPDTVKVPKVAERLFERP